jgi:Do/DeqQ family serine protease
MISERLRQMFDKGRKPAALAGVVLLTGLLIGWTAADARLAAAPGAPPAAAAGAVPEIQQGRGAAMRAPDSYADIVAQVSPAVVTIRSERVVREAASPLSDDPFFRQFFGQQGRNFNPRPQPREEGALGSGVIVSPDGYILTNAHVVEGASKIRVELTDRRTFVAKLVGSDKPSDLAVLKIDANGLHSLPLGDTRQVRVGDVVLAVGNPLGVGQTVTMGIISAKGRATGGGDGSFEDFLQTDAPINQGNSGGPLVNTRGELVGINSQILSPSGGSIGIGFAIPSNMAQNVMAQLIKTGTVRRARIGVTVQAVNSELAESLGLHDVRGAIVSTVDADSPAQKAGIERGDVITAFDGQPVTDSNDLRNRVASSTPGSRATVTLYRSGREETKTVTLGELSSTLKASYNGEEGSNGDRFGMSVEPLTPELANQMGLRAKRGLIVQEVAPASVASDAGLQSGDVIVEVNHRPVNTMEQFREAVGASSGRPALLLVNRQGNDLFIALSPKRG